MPRRHSAARIARLAAAVLLLAGCGAPEPEPASSGIAIGLSTSLPIYWPEAADPSELLGQNLAMPWPRALIERQHRLVPLDTLAEASALSRVDAIMLVQPRPLSAEENVALDAWVRAGGHVLLFADPLLTEHSRFALGDKRRPQDVAMLSPILARWGLELLFDEAQPPGERVVEDSVIGPIPINMAGRLAPAKGPRETGDRCELDAEALIARCRIGRGSAMVIADAALFELHPDSPDPKQQTALERLLDFLAQASAGMGGANRGHQVPQRDSRGGLQARSGGEEHD